MAEMAIEAIWFGKVKEDIAKLSGSSGRDSNKVCVVKKKKKKSKDKFKSKGVANLSGSDGGNSNNVCVVEVRIRFG